MISKDFEFWVEHAEMQEALIREQDCSLPYSEVVNYAHYVFGFVLAVSCIILNWNSTNATERVIYETPVIREDRIKKVA